MREMSRSRGRALPLAAAAVALLAALLARPARVGAQQWATAPNGADVYNASTSTGKVGVGTQAPAYVFHAEGASTDTNKYVQGYFKNTSAERPYGGVAVDGVNQSHLRFLLGGQTKWQWRVGAGSGVDDLRAFSWGLSADVLTLKNNGFVGVGTDAPSSQLHVAGGSAAGFVRVSGAGGGVMNFEDTSAAGGSKLYQWRSEGGAFRLALSNDANSGLLRPNILVANASGHVGIGTGSPDKFFTVQGQVPSALGVMSVVRTTGTHHGYGLALDATGSGNNNLGFMKDGAVKASAAWDGRGFLGFVNTQYQSGSDFALRLNSDGSLSYHDSAQYPGPERFRVTAAGDMTVTGTITADNIVAKFQDVAEWVPSTQKLQAGTVVVLDAGRTNHVLASSSAYDTKVAGVVSARPGLALGEAGEGKALVATTGRVKVKVDATRGAIRVGDLLVTSGVEGVAMKSTPVDLGGTPIHRPGTIIGKALEPLEKGVGEILVLLSLQ